MREELNAAGDVLEAAIDDADPGVRDRLRDQAEDLRTLATADRDPDHGRLARHESALHEIADADPGVEAQVRTALDHIHAFRETIEGV